MSRSSTPMYFTPGAIISYFICLLYIMCGVENTSPHTSITSLLLQSFLNGSTLSLITRLIEECKHVLFVSLHTRLVEWIHTQHQTRDTTALLKEIDKLAYVILIQFLDRHLEIWHATIHMSQLSTKFRHLVHLVNTFASQEVQTVKVLLVSRHLQRCVRILH